MSVTIAAPAAQWANEPFTTPTPEQFARLRALFVRRGFTEPDICTVGGVERVYDLPSFRKRTDTFIDATEPQALLVRLFLDGLPVPWTTVRATLGDGDVAQLSNVGLIQTSIVDSDFCTASVALYPHEGLYIVSDKHSNLESVATGIPADVVYSALTSETHRFVDLMPRVRCGDYLELCSGTGIAALLAAESFAERTWAVDITERSTRFAQFNAALNGLSNVTAVTGDLYAVVSGQTFDVITAHPPYVPSIETQIVYRDGGEDGEQITRRIIGGLAEHLRPGGQFYCDCVMTDRKDAPLEQRIRSMLGPAQDEFDVLLGQTSVFDGDGYLARLAQATGRKARGPEELAWHRALVERLGIERFVNAAFIIQRRSDVRPVFTRRRVVSPTTTAADLQWYLRWAAETTRWGDDLRQLLDARPRRVDDTELRSRSVFRAGEWMMLESTLVAQRPFAHELQCPTWLAALFARCDGSVTVREHLRHFRDIGVVPESATDAEFALLIGQLADGGYVELDDFRLPSLDAGASFLA